MNAEMLDATLDADAGALVIGQGQMKGERVAPPGVPMKTISPSRNCSSIANASA